MSYLSTLLGFRTARAKDVVKKGVDHHKTKQIFSICLEVLSKELLLPFLRESMEKNTNISVENFQGWLHKVQNQSFLFSYHVTFSYLLSFHFHICYHFIFTLKLLEKTTQQMLWAGESSLHPYSIVFINQNSSNYIYVIFGKGYKCLNV